MKPSTRNPGFQRLGGLGQTSGAIHQVITRFHVQGFKNFRDVEVDLGPLTCLAGANGVGKSNFFDALVFLKDLATVTFVEAASRVRGGIEPANLFSAGGSDIGLSVVKATSDLPRPRVKPHLS